jgi:hypothetical protein
MIGPELAGRHGHPGFVIRTSVKRSDIQDRGWRVVETKERRLQKGKFSDSRSRPRPINDVENVRAWFGTESFRPIESFVGGANNNEV